MDANLTLSSHLNDLCKKAFFFIKSIGLIRKYLPPDPLKRLVNALLISHLDYCNSLLYGLSSNKLAKPQRVQNTAARLIVGARRFDQMTPILRDLYWLPIVIVVTRGQFVAPFKHRLKHVNVTFYSQQRV